MVCLCKVGLATFLLDFLLNAFNAKWLYGWVKTWELNSNGNVKTKNGTPVIVYGVYDFKKVSPWSLLATDSTLITITSDEINSVITKYYR